MSDEDLYDNLAEQFETLVPDEQRIVYFKVPACVSNTQFERVVVQVASGHIQRVQ